LNIGARYGLEILDKSDNQKKVRTHTSNGHGNVFLESSAFEIDTTAPYPRQYNNLIEDYASALNKKSTKSITELTKDFLKYIIISTKELCEGNLIKRYGKIAAENPIQYHGKIYNGLNGTSTPKQQSPDNYTQNSWSDLVGQEEAKNLLEAYENRIKLLKHNLRRQTKLDLLQNFLMKGPKGVGKTLSAKILRNRCSIPFKELSLRDILDTYKDGAAQKVYEAFEEASAPILNGISDVSLLYIDEIDIILKARGGNSSGEDDKVATAVMECTSDDKQIPGLVVSGSTNRIFTLSDAGRSRFPIEVHYSLPDVEAQNKLYAHFISQKEKLKATTIFDDIDYSAIINHAINPANGQRFGGREIKGIVNDCINTVIDEANKIAIDTKTVPDYRLCNTDDLMAATTRKAESLRHDEKYTCT